MLRLNKIHQALIEAYWTACSSHNPKDAWLDSEKLSRIQLRYSARIRELREKGINVETESLGGGRFRYRLLTNPDTIDWQTLTAKISDERIRNVPKRKVKPNELQEKLF